MADNLIPLKRPKPEDDEEEILRMQEEFSAKKLTPCVKVISLHSQKSKENTTAKKQSKFAKSRNQETHKRTISTSQAYGNITNKGTEDVERSEKEEFKVDPINNYTELSTNIVLGNVIERTFDLKEYTTKNERDTKDRNSSFELVNNADSSPSFFMRAVANKYSSNSSSTNADEIDVSFPSNSSCLITGPWAQEIHNENISKLKDMSKDEILAEKKNLETLLNPDTIAFIKSMWYEKNKPKHTILEKCKQENTISSNTMEVDEPSSKDSQNELTNNEMQVDKCNSNDLKDTNLVMNNGSYNEELPKPVVDIAKEAEVHGYVHMDDPEPEKVKWMEDLQVAQNEDKDKPMEEPYNARFDFNGVLLPFKDENVTVDKGLHHHGEEPDRPGYSLQELLQLSRSAAQQQRCTALTTLANILEKTHLGWYDKVLQPPLLTTLNQKNILLFLRFSLDDTAVPIVTASLQALRAFLFSETDEICLDKIFGLEDFKEPILKPTMNDVENSESLKDHELAQFDTVAAAIRSDIVLRLRFVLSEMQLPPIAMTSALEILTRLARHSPETALNIACTQNLLNVIVKKCIPFSMSQPVPDRDSSKEYGCPLVAAIRLCRILINYAGKPVVEKLKNLQILHSLLTYINSDASKHEVRLHIESFRLWRMFLHYGIQTDSIVGARLTLIAQLRRFASTLDLDTVSPLTCDYAAALIAIAKYDEPLKEHVAVLLMKWSAQLSTLSAPGWNVTILIVEALKTLDNIDFFQRIWINNSNIFMQLSSSSNLLSELEFSSNRYPSSLPNLGVMTVDGNLQPIMAQYSKIVFIKTAFEFFLKRKCYYEIEQILSNGNVKNYFQRLKTSHWSLERSWYTRIEYSFLLTIIQAATQLKIENTALKTFINEIIWKIAIKLISALPADCAMNIRDVLAFSLDSERIRSRMRIELMNKNLENLSLDNTLKLTNEEIKDVQNPRLAIKLYEKFISMNGNWYEAAMPKDWLYLPLIDLYTQIKNERISLRSKELDVLMLLNLELTVPELTQDLSPSLRFSRLVLPYLCSTTFLYNMSVLPQKCMMQLVRPNYKKLDLSGDVPGLNSFTDLFTAVCENFKASSFGEDSFSQVLLVFIAQRYDVHYRKLLWSEHADAIQYLRVAPEKLLIPFEEYLYPLEKDISLIEAYITALIRNTVRQNQSPVLYAMALHHAAMYLKESNKLATVMRSRLERLLNDKSKMVVVQNLLTYEPVTRI